MKKLIVLAVASLFATSAYAGEMKWSGSAAWRYNNTKQNDGLGSTATAVGGFTGPQQVGKGISEQMTRSHALRANLGVAGGWENVEWGASVRTGGAATRNTDWANLANNGDIGLGFDQAWFRYVRDFGSLDMTATIGRQMNVFASDGMSEQLFDKDLRFDGAGWQFKFGMFGLNAAQYILGARSSGTAVNTNAGSSQSFTDASDASAASQAKFFTMFGFQPHMNWKFTDDIETMFAVGYYVWSDDSNTNTTGGGYNSSTINAANNSKPAIAPGTFRITNPRQWQFLNTWTLPYKLSVSWEYVKNHEQKYSTATIGAFNNGRANVEVGSSAFSIGAKYGDVKKAHDWSVSYNYGSKGIASVIGNYSNNLILPDNKGHTFNATYAIADNFHLGFKWISMSEKERKNTADVAAATNVTAQTAGQAYTGLQANQEQKMKYFELTTGVMF